MTDTSAEGAVCSSLVDEQGFCLSGSLENGKLLDPQILVLATAAAWMMASQGIGCPRLAQTQMSKGVDDSGCGADDSAPALLAVLLLVHTTMSWRWQGGQW
jgi:hypothetical protein